MLSNMNSFILHCIYWYQVMVNPLLAETFEKHAYFLYLILYESLIKKTCSGCQNSSSRKTRNDLLYLVIIITADGLVTQGARASSGMVWTFNMKYSIVCRERVNIHFIFIMMFSHTFSMSSIIFCEFTLNLQQCVITCQIIILNFIDHTR